MTPRALTIALASGAQLLSTDYPAGEPSAFSPYLVTLPDNAVARCNPVNSPRACDARSLRE